MAPRVECKADLTGKVALLAACTNGIGLAIAKRYVKCGAKVSICSRKQSNVDDAIEALRSIDNVNKEDVIGMVCHVSNKDQRLAFIDLTISTFGKIDIFIENAGVNPAFGIDSIDVPETMWRKMMDVNILAAALFVQEVYPHMKANGCGKIILIGSLGSYSSVFELGPYASTKAALLSMVKEFARPLAKYNININCISTGYIDTKFGTSVTQELISKLINQFAIKRRGNVEEVAGAAVFLASDDSNYMTGESVVIAGGAHSRL